MEWTYKTVHIAVNGEGFFCAKVNNKSIRTLTLNECKKN